MQENKARAVIVGEKAVRVLRFIKNRNGSHGIDETALQRARRLFGLKGYIANIDALKPLRSATIDVHGVVATYPPALNAAVNAILHALNAESSRH